MSEGPFKTHGLVEHLVSDNGTCFSATEFQAFCARNATPHKMMSHTLAELLVNHKMTLRLDLVRQRVNVRVHQQQECQKEYNGGIDRGFVPQDTVFAKNHGQGDPWLRGTVTKQIGPMSYQVHLNRGGPRRRHVDQLHSWQSPRRTSKSQW